MTVLFSAALAWTVTMATTLAVAARFHTAFGIGPVNEEFLFAFALAIALPFALALWIVYVPVFRLTRLVAGRWTPHALYAAAGALAFPLTTMFYLILMRVANAGHPRMTPSLWHDLGRLIDRPLLGVPYLAGLLIGGAVFGATYARSRDIAARAGLTVEQAR